MLNHIRVANPIGQETTLHVKARSIQFMLLVALLVLPALWFLFRPGFFVSDDGRFHIYRIAALAQAWEHGVLYPRLFPEFGFGYGQAVFNFYAPLSYWPGALLALLGVGPAAAAELTIALGFVLAALAAYGYANYVWGPPGGVLAAVAYTYFPYHLADAYLRGAIPEHFAFIWPPLILWAYTAAFREERPRAPLLWGTLAWAGLVYTHNLTALLMVPVVGLYALIMAWWTGRWRRLLPASGSLALAVGLTAPLWLPFLAESGSVGIGLGLSDGYQKHLAPFGSFVLTSPFYRYRVEQGGAADHPLSWMTLALFVVVLALTLWRFVRRERLPSGPVVGFSLLLTLGSAFMVTNASLPIWLALRPVLANLQYPWRFLTLTAVGVLGLAGALPSLLFPSQLHTVYFPAKFAVKVGAWGVVAVVGLLLLLHPLPGIPVEPLPITDSEAWAPDRMWREDAEAGQVGATWTGEFLPLTVSEQRWALGRSRPGAVDGPAPTSKPRVQLTRLGYLLTELQIDTGTPLAVRLHQFHLPGWEARLDDRPVPAYPSGELGLVTVDVPVGRHDLCLSFGTLCASAPTAGGVLALLSAAVWILLAWQGRRSGRALVAGAVALALMGILFGLNSLGLGQQTWTPKPAQVAFEDVALLLGYDVAPARGQSALDVTLYWFALREVAADYKAFVHLVAAPGSGQVAAQHDGDPGGGFTPTTRWRSGEIIADRHRVPLPPNLPAGEYIVKAGLYQLASGNVPRNLAVDPPAQDGRAELGRIRLPVE